jgi:hypothetical protein
MSLVHQCCHPDCHVLTMGMFCVEHDHKPALEFSLRDLTTQTTVVPVWSSATDSSTPKVRI